MQQISIIFSIIALFSYDWVNSYRTPYNHVHSSQDIKHKVRIFHRKDSTFVGESANRALELGDWSIQVAKNLAELVVNGTSFLEDANNASPVESAIEKISEDLDLLDKVANRSPQLTTVELAVLLTTILLSALSPFFLDIEVIEVLVPSLAAISASVGISAEYIGKVAVSNGKEFAALAIIAASEAESLLAEAERSKAVLPLCLGIATSASVLSIITNALIKDLKLTEAVYFISPLIGMIAAAIAESATHESQKLASRAVYLGNKIVNTAGSLNQTRSNEEEIKNSNQKWRWSILNRTAPPVIGAFFPGPLSTKSIVCAALAAAQSAYYISVAEYSISLATNAVALKARSAAFSDFYANQASRASAILPFTSALAGFCAAASAAAVELLPFVNTFEQAFVAVLFPSGAALFAAAAAVSKARCEVDAAAAGAVANMEYFEVEALTEVIKDPIQVVEELIEITLKTGLSTVIRKTNILKTIVKEQKVFSSLKNWWLDGRGRGKPKKPLVYSVEW